MMRSRMILVCCIMLSGCQGKKHEIAKPTTGSEISSLPVTYASGFSIEVHNDQWIINVTDPWQNAQHITYTYTLSNFVESSEIVSNHECIIKTPVRRVVCLSTTHIGFIDCLGETESIVGISGKDYVVNEQLRNKIEQDGIADVGYDENLNYELILKLHPDVVFAYGISGSVTRIVNKLNELNIPVVIVAEYLEQHPLAKMEWVKFFSAFYENYSEAETRFDVVATEYNHLAALSNDVSERPEVILGLPWRGTWYVSGGKSYAAQLIEDAGGEYVWKVLDFKDSKPIELEKVYEKALFSDFWLNTGDAQSKIDIARTDERFKNLFAYQNDFIFNNNKLLSPSGGNAYFEQGVVEPHIILADLISILHPQLLPSHKLKYYKKLQ